MAEVTERVVGLGKPVAEDPVLIYAQVVTLQRALEMLLAAHRAAVELLVKSGRSPILAPFEEMAPVRVAREAMSSGPVKLSERLQLLELLYMRAGIRKAAKERYIEALEGAFKEIKVGQTLKRDLSDSAYEVVKHTMEEEDTLVETLRLLDSERDMQNRVPVLEG